MTECPYLPEAVVVAEVGKQSREEWLRTRQQGIGGSDAAAILGVSPWTSAYSLWLDKTAENPLPSEETAAMRFGTLMEAPIRQTYRELTGDNVVEPRYSYQHPEFPFMYANLDGLILDQDGFAEAVLEVKTAANPYAWVKGVPAYYVAQVQHYMAVTNLDRAVVVVLLAGEDIQWYEVPADKDYQAVLIKAEGEFWQSVQDRTEPQLDGSKATHEAIRKTWTADSGKATDLSAEVLAVIEQRKEVTERIAELEAEKRECEAYVMKALEDAEVGTFDGRTIVTWKEQTTNRLDTKALKEAHPDLAAEFTKASTSRVLRIKEAK